MRKYLLLFSSILIFFLYLFFFPLNQVKSQTIHPGNSHVAAIPVYEGWISLARISNPTITTSSSVITLPTKGGVARLCNLNAAAAGDYYLVFGTVNTITASNTTGSWLPATKCGNFALQPYPGVTYTYLAAICTGTCSSSTMYVETGSGNMYVGQ